MHSLNATREFNNANHGKHVLTYLTLHWLMALPTYVGIYQALPLHPGHTVLICVIREMHFSLKYGSKVNLSKNFLSETV